MVEGDIGVILGFYRETGREHGNYYIILGLYWGGLYRDRGKEMETSSLGFSIGFSWLQFIIPPLYPHSPYWGDIGITEKWKLLVEGSGG